MKARQNAVNLTRRAPHPPPTSRCSQSAMWGKDTPRSRRAPALSPAPTPSPETASSKRAKGRRRVRRRIIQFRPCTGVAKSLSATISPTSPRPTDGGWSRPNARARHELVKPEDASYRPIQETLPSPLGMGESLFESGPPELKTRSFVPLSSSPSSVCSVPVRRPVASRSASASRSTPQSPEFGPAATQAELENLELKFSLLPPAEQRASAKVMKPAQTGTACSTQPRAVRLVCRPGHDASAWHPAQTPVFRPQCQRWRNQ